MPREPFFGQLDRDVACAIALGLVESPRVVANLQAVTLMDARMQTLGTQPNWLDGDDPLDAIVRDYLTARKTINQSSAKPLSGGGWAGAGAVKAREQALKTAAEAKVRAEPLIKERGVLALAKSKGYRVVN